VHTCAHCTERGLEMAQTIPLKYDLYEIRCLEESCRGTKAVVDSVEMYDGEILFAYCLHCGRIKQHVVERVLKRDLPDDDFAPCEFCQELVEIETVLDSSGLTNLCMNCQNVIE